ncbi:hypothetical protein [Niveispirillum sp. BGYR6]|uniref:hypothetical protein n=1 Tax=Niveispirillum sp. BGYR6 TaxID=2971249 RepID=UPI0022B94CE7|nr:hypothetical protein [Niveispirillum sp. BGYR6]MDG5493784.1 hypothetical protein [Niveispirillum sp. BGYR6]
MTKKHLPPPFAPIRGINTVAQSKPQAGAARVFAPPPLAPIRTQGTVTQLKEKNPSSGIFAPFAAKGSQERLDLQKKSFCAAKNIQNQSFLIKGKVPKKHNNTIQMMKRSSSYDNISEEFSKKKVLISEMNESSDDNFGFQHSDIYKKTVIHLQQRMESSVDPVNKIKGESLEQYTRRSLNMSGFYVVDLNTIKNNSAGLDLIAFKGNIIKLIQCKNFTGTQLKTSETTLLRNFLKELHGSGEGASNYRRKLLAECIANVVADRFAKEVTNLNNDIENMVVKYRNNVDIIMPDGLSNKKDDDNAYDLIDRDMVMSITGLGLLQSGHRKRILAARRNRKTDTDYFKAYDNLMEKREKGVSNVKYVRKLDDDDDYEDVSDYSSDGE